MARASVTSCLSHWWDHLGHTAEGIEPDRRDNLRDGAPTSNHAMMANDATEIAHAALHRGGRYCTETWEEPAPCRRILCRPPSTGRTGISGPPLTRAVHPGV